MIDVKLLREHPELVRTAVGKKKFDVDFDAIQALDGQRRAIIAEAETARSRQNAANAEMARMPKGTPEFIEKVKEMKGLAVQVKELQARQATLEEQWNALLLTVPNLPHDSVPVGRGEEDNVPVASWGDPASVSSQARPHWDIPGFAESVDLARGVKVTGAGFPFYKGDVARLVRALLQFFLDENTAAGYVEVMPPILVNAASATATGQLPDKEGQMYFASQDELYIVPTAEVPVTNLYRDEILEGARLPVKHCAYTPCFRREAGSWGAHVRGLNRLHQFDKVELVVWSHPDHSFEQLETLRGDAERLLRLLELPYRTLLMCSRDIGFPHAKQYDLEVWAAGQKRWLEVSSCSNFTDFQARRANIRFRDPEGKPRFVHTLNGSALAIPRILAAILENNLAADGRIRVPPILQTRVGREWITLG